MKSSFFSFISERGGLCHQAMTQAGWICVLVVLAPSSTRCYIRKGDSCSSNLPVLVSQCERQLPCPLTAAPARCLLVLWPPADLNQGVISVPDASSIISLAVTSGCSLDIFLTLIHFFLGRPGVKSSGGPAAHETCKSPRKKL